MGMVRYEALKVSVQVSAAYEVIIDAGFASEVLLSLPAKRIGIISDSTVLAIHGEALLKSLEHAGKQVACYTFSPGETSKTIETFMAASRQFLREGLDRKSAIMALGGGVVGDVAGFVAASYMRGIDFYQLPTSLLSMVDASVGGKTGINTAEGKNLLGAFWQPKAVLISTQTLQTLPLSEFKQGAVEHFKHGLLADSHILDDILHPEFKPQGDPEFLKATIARSVAVKASIVARDERESGERAFLNLGHTLAHALESATRHALPHGDAVAYGLLFTALLAKGRGFADETGRVLELLRWLKPAPLLIERLEVLEPYMLRDKKAEAGKLRFVLLREVGQPELVTDISLEERQVAWSDLGRLTKDL